MEQKDRKRIMASIKYVDEVVICNGEQEDVSTTLREINPDIFAKGYSASAQEKKFVSSMASP